MLDNAQPRSASSNPVLDIIGEVRNRWRLKLALRGVLRVGLVAVVLILAAAFGIEQARFSPASVWAARGLLLAALAASGYWFLFRPLRRQVSDDQVALYLEEHEPSLQATLLSAVEASRAGNPESAALVRRVVEQAVEACSRIGASRRVEQAPLRGYAASLAAVALLALVVVLTGPAFIRQALGAMFLVSARRGGGAVLHRGEAGEHVGAEGIRSDHLREAARLRLGRRHADDAARARTASSSRSRSCAPKAAPTRR